MLFTILNLQELQMDADDSEHVVEEPTRRSSRISIENTRASSIEKEERRWVSLPEVRTANPEEVGG